MISVGVVVVLRLRSVQWSLVVGTLPRLAVLGSVRLGRVANIRVRWSWLMVRRWRWLMVRRWWWWRWRLIVMRLMVVGVLLHVVSVARSVDRHVVTFRFVLRFMVIFLMRFVMVRFMVVRFMRVLVMVEQDGDSVVMVVIMSSVHWDHHIILHRRWRWRRWRRSRRSGVQHCNIMRMITFLDIWSGQAARTTHCPATNIQISTPTD